MITCWNYKCCVPLFPNGLQSLSNSTSEIICIGDWIALYRLRNCILLTVRDSGPLQSFFWLPFSADITTWVPSRSALSRWKTKSPRIHDETRGPSYPFIGLKGGMKSDKGSPRLIHFVKQKNAWKNEEPGSSQLRAPHPIFSRSLRNELEGWRDCPLLSRATK